MMKLRMHFQKTGRARFISHLDLMQVFRRALLRAGLPLRYSEGYNPHAVLSVALPLPVGVAGLCEIVDFSLTHPVSLEPLAARINGVLPEGIAVLDTAPASRPVGEIKAARYELSFAGGAEQMPALHAVFDGRSLMVEKRTKKGTAVLDIAGAVTVERIAAGGDGGLRLQAVLPTENPALSPEHLLAAVRAHWPESGGFYTEAARLAILGEDGIAF